MPKRTKRSLDYRYLDLLLAMTEKEIKARYKHAVFGFLWIVLNPLLQMVVIGFVFQYVTRIPIDNYLLFLFTGLLPWNFFSMTVLKNTPMIVYERNLIQKAKFPRETIILSIVLANAFHLIVSLLLLLPILALFHTLSWGTIVWLPLVLGWIMILTSGLSMVLATLNVRFRDINFIVQAVMPLWFYATPILYTLEFIPTFLQKWFLLNPMTGIVEVFHYALLGVPITNVVWLGLSGAVTAILLGLGILLFKRESPYFVDWV